MESVHAAMLTPTDHHAVTQLRPKSHRLVPSFLSQWPALLSHQLQTWLLSRLLYTSFINTSAPSKSQFRSAPTYFAYSFQAVPRILPSSYQRLPSLLALCLLWFYSAKFSVIPCCNYCASKGLHDVYTRSYKSKLNHFFKLFPSQRWKCSICLRKEQWWRHQQ